jgi:methionine-rich copper-binding protein CopC
MMRSLLGLAALALAPTVALAHAVLTKASLQGTAVRAGSPTDVKLRFNTGIEPAFTRVYLVRAKGKEQTLDVSATDDRAVVDVALPSLDAGTYGLHYKVLAADGHVTESVLKFTVAPAE